MQSALLYANLRRDEKAWRISTEDPSGYTGYAAMIALPDTQETIDENYATTSPELQYRVHFNTPGTYFVWIRGYAEDGGSNSVHVGLDGQMVESASQITTGEFGVWSWTNRRKDGQVATIHIEQPGTYTINVWMREDGFVFDRLLLTTNANDVAMQLR